MIGARIGAVAGLLLIAVVAASLLFTGEPPDGWRLTTVRFLIDGIAIGSALGAVLGALRTDVRARGHHLA